MNARGVVAAGLAFAWVAAGCGDDDHTVPVADAGPDQIGAPAGPICG